MILPELCIRRPVFTTMLVLLPVVVGILSYTRMGVDLFPNVDLPIVIITTTRAGASVEEMETGVTKQIEEAVNTISGIDELRSTTKEGISIVNITFVLEKNRDVAQQEVQGKINTILTKLPTGTDTPIVDKFDIDAAPVMTIALSGKRSLKEVTEIADKRVKDQLSSLAGVGAVSLVGGVKRAIQVTVDADKLDAYGLSIDDVRHALERQNIELPGGRVDQQSRELVLRTMGRVEQPDQFNDIIIASIPEQNGQPIRIRDVGRAVDTSEEPRGLGRLDGENNVLLVVQKQSGTNTVKVIDTVKRKLAQIEAGFAQTGKSDLKMVLIRDQSTFINGSLHEVQKHLLIGALLVSMTILLFLRDWRTMLIASLSIPTSLVATFMVMNWLGFTLNNITMLALVLSVGIVIDDAVVVHENIFRWMEEKGKRAWDAALGATKEIALAVMATTLSLVVIFLPIAFMSGRVGRFFFSFGVTTAVAILMSMLVSFTLTPMLCSRFLKLSKKAIEAQKHGKSHHSGGVYGWIAEKPYLWILRWSMRHRWAVVLATVVTVASIFPLPFGRWLSHGNPTTARRLAFLDYPGLAGMIGLDFIPKDDQSEFEIAITTPAGWTLQHTSEVFERIEKKLRAWPEVVHVLTTIGDTTGKVSKGQGDVTQGSIYVRLIELEDRAQAPTGPFSQFDLMARARAMLAADPQMCELRASVQIPSKISTGSANADVEFNLVGPDLRKLGEYSDRIIQTLRRTPGLADVDTTTALRKPEMRVIVDRERAMDQQVPIQSVSATLRTLVGGEIVTDYKDNQLGELYDVWLRARGIDRHDKEHLEHLRVPSGKSGLVEISNIAKLEEARGPAQIDRYARQRKIGIVANLGGEGMTTSKAVAAFQAAAAGLHMPADYQLIATGRAKTQAESNLAFLMALVLSLLFMYMILAAQFESFIHPVTILLAVPLTIPFALLSLIALGSSLTIYSILGVFLLFGIVKKNGILQVDYTNVLRARAAADPNEVPGAFRDPAPGTADGSWLRWMKRQPEHRRVRLWALLEANRTRLRPILMTTVMLIAGMIPIALGQGPGAASRASMAQVIVGGQALSLLLSLLVTPVAYSLFDDVRNAWRRRKPPGG
jgi:HAE1 family hydrophobic/amphiphilic exporter-1